MSNVIIIVLSNYSFICTDSGCEALIEDDVMVRVIEIMELHENEPGGTSWANDPGCLFKAFTQIRQMTVDLCGGIAHLGLAF